MRRKALVSAVVALATGAMLAIAGQAIASPRPTPAPTAVTTPAERAPEAAQTAVPRPSERPATGPAQRAKPVRTDARFTG